LPKSYDGPFVQIEAGSVYYNEYIYFFPAFSGGLSAGWRFNLGQNFYSEGAIRGGYPHAWGVNITAGIRFPPREKPAPEAVYIYRRNSNSI